MPVVISLKNIVLPCPLSISPVARPRVIRVDDCVPALPPVSISMGIKNVKAIAVSNEAEYVFRILPEKLSNKTSNASHPPRLLTSSAMLKLK